jgi:chromosome segregation protein
MFKLQRLEITGFKSFADYTEIVFTGGGITAVVGPNGCGKSNVSDSIAWVLGEQRVKQLRGEEMKDVVFQGTSKRKPSGMAEVVLHLVRDEEFEFAGDEDELSGIDETLGKIDENVVDLTAFETQNDEFTIHNSQSATNGNGFHADEVEVEKALAAQVGSAQTIETKVKTKRHWKSRSFALDFAPGEAVSVTRRLYLSGESEYQLNGKTCRLRDIQDLFAGTGLSGAHYALIEQGRIGQILSAKPSDRRNLIEEAAGISKFRTRQRAAEARLESAKLNLRRISDIVSEIETQAGGLRRQAAKTRRYRTLREEFRASLRQTFSAEGKHLTELVKQLEEKLDEATKAERRVFWAVAEKDDAFREATQTARQAEENLSELRARHSENALTRDRNEREIQYKNEQIKNLRERFAVLKSEIAATEQKLKLLRAEIERLKTEEQKERRAAAKAELDLHEAENGYHAELKELNEIEKTLEAERHEVLQHATAFERLTEIRRQLENTGERLEERCEGLRREGMRAGETFAEHSKEAEKLEKSLIKERGKLENLHAEKRQIVEESSKARTVLQTAEKILSDLREEFTRKKNRLETLQELEEKHAVYAPTVQKLFSEEKKIGVKFLGTLADKLDVAEQAEKAVENLFGAYLQTVLVESEADARKTIRFLNENNLGRISVLVFNAKAQRRNGAKEDFAPQINTGEHRFEIKPHKTKKNEQKMSDFLVIENGFEEILTKTFPREMSAKLVESFENLSIKDNETFVSFDGDLVFGGKLFVGGKTNASEKNTSLLAFKRELRELGNATEKLNREIEKAEKEAAKAREILTEKENKLVDLQSFVVKIERELLAQEIQAKSLAQEIERAERHRKIVGEEAKQIEMELVEIRKKRSEAESNAKKAETARITATENLAKISNQLTEARTKVEAKNVVLNEKRTLAATSGERRRSAQTALRGVENENTELESRLVNQNLENLETENKTKDLETSIAEITGKIESAGDERENEQNELATANAHLKVAREQADATSSELAALNKQSAEARNERAALEIRQTEAMTKLRNLNEKCLQELNLSLAELVENEPLENDFDLDAARRAVEDLREKITNFGAINMLALEELAEIEERLSFLTVQRQDIIDSITAAEEALREIKERSREKFRAAFTAINENFREFFQELFGGGRGEMTLLEAEDVLEAGIEIVAQPPGKRLQNILLLSGGEKAMTAIALVMAIFKYRPAPFCLLDEVDAPLDDANVGRFVGKIAEMSEKTQFIVITHNKRTMEAARALYGVTMQEAGVSKVVSVRFE